MMQNLKAIILGLIVTIGASYAMAGSWKEPGCAATGCNTPDLLRISTTSQYKMGPLSIGTNVIPATDYVLSVIGGNALFEGLVTNGLTIKDGNQGNGKLLFYNATTKLGEWRKPPDVTGTVMTVKDFSVNVIRNTSQTLTIPSTYQYCAISQIGPDFANSDFPDSECSVKRNSDETWKLFGNRSDDPDFICAVRCFSINNQKPTYSITNFVPPPTSKNGLKTTSGLEGRIIYID